MPPSSSPYQDGRSIRFRLISLEEWWSEKEGDDLHSDIQSERRPRCLLDLRPQDAFDSCRLEHSSLVTVCIPFNVLRSRSFELPARHVEFSVLLEDGNVEALETAESFLLGGRPPSEKSRKLPQRPWMVRYAMLANAGFWNQAQALGIQSTETAQQQFPFPRLWQPDSMVQDVLLPALRQLTIPRGNHQRTKMQILDLASGSARDAAFLAEELLASPSERDFMVVALDQRYNEKEGNIVTDFFRRRQVDGVSKWIRMDLARWSNVKEWLLAAYEREQDFTNYHCTFLCVRFWKRSLVEALAEDTNVAAGTLFATSHFCKPHVGAKWKFEHPNEKNVLERNELVKIFSRNNMWLILHDQIALDSDHGRTMIHFLAKRL